MLPLGAVVVGASAGYAFARYGGCDGDPLTLFSVENVLHCQKVSDFLISLAYFSIPLELFYFVTCAAIFPFRWIFVQFGAFIVLCGLTHLATVFTYAPHSFLLMLVLTVLKFLTALVSVATAITLLPLIPQILRVLVREGLLRKKTRDMDREVGLMKRQEEASWHAHEIVREIRRSLDRRTIIDTTMVELAKVLLLQSCAVWMPAGPSNPRKMILRHGMKPHRRGRPVLMAAAVAGAAAASVPVDDREVAEIVDESGIVFLGPSSKLLCKEDGPFGPAVAIRIATRRASNSRRDRRGNSSEHKEEEPDYAILVLALPANEERAWMAQELEIIEVVADQVSVALSHCAAFEETLTMREKLQERNTMLKRAQQEAIKANDARMLFRSVMTGEMMGPVRAVAAVLSSLQLEKLKPEQLAMVKGGLVLSSLIQDTADVSAFEENKLEVSLRPFALRPALEEAVMMAKLLCCCRGVPFHCTVSGKIPVGVVGDERHILEAVLFMVAHLLGSGDQGPVTLRIYVEEGSQGAWKQGRYDDLVKLGFEARKALVLGREDPATSESPGYGEHSSHTHGMTVCEQLARLMNGNLSVGAASQSLGKEMALVVKLQRKRSQEGKLRPKAPPGGELSESTRAMLEGMSILLVDGDTVNRSASRRVFERLGCRLTTASSWFECSELLYLRGSRFHLLLIDAAVLSKEGSDMSAQLGQLCSEGRLIAIALVPKGENDPPEWWMATGVQGAIAKPVVLQEMALELGRITQRLHPPSALP
ncbi:unnamed protein product [Spirodela intermedia]|uniref:histidine kinase n=1 Tax=Spirodela intermedia TaxID=51605 RepID=A0A7I8K1V2_SPIIN|nr:unnamed protein product [Spirodela intermedia]